MKTCDTCAHFRPQIFKWEAKCLRPLDDEIEPVHGAYANTLYKPCRTERKNGMRGWFRRTPKCGPDAIFYKSTRSA